MNRNISTHPIFQFLRTGSKRKQQTPLLFTYSQSEGENYHCSGWTGPTGKTESTFYLPSRPAHDPSPSSSSHLPGEPPPLSREEVMAVKKAKSSSSSTLPGKQSHTQNGHGLPSKLARYLDPDASWDKVGRALVPPALSADSLTRSSVSFLVDVARLFRQDQLLDALHWIRQVLGLVCGLLWGAIPLVGAVWIAL
jgi:hypothetical protein